MQLLFFLPPMALSDILDSIMSDSELNNNLINIPLTVCTRNIPRYFFSSILDPFLGIVDMVVLNMNLGIIPC